MALFAEELKDKNLLVAQQPVRKTGGAGAAALRGEPGRRSRRIHRAASPMRTSASRAPTSGSRICARPPLQKAVEELRETETELDDVQEQIRAAHDVVERIEVRAPVRGIVVKLHFHTTAASSAPGAVILELLPVQDELSSRRTSSPTTSRMSATGQDALVRLSALNQRVTPMIEGKVVYLSADAVERQAVGGQGRSRKACRSWRISMSPACAWTKTTSAAGSGASCRRRECPPTSTSRPASGPSSSTSCDPSTTAFARVPRELTDGGRAEKIGPL